MILFLPLATMPFDEELAALLTRLNVNEEELDEPDRHHEWHRFACPSTCGEYSVDTQVKGLRNVNLPIIWPLPPTGLRETGDEALPSRLGVVLMFRSGTLAGSFEQLSRVGLTLYMRSC